MKPAPPPPRKETVYQCFRFIYLFLYYLGSLGFRQKPDELIISFGTKLYSHCVRLALLAGFVGGLRQKLGNEESYTAMVGHLSPVLRVILVLECLSSSLTYLQVVATMETHKYEHVRLAGRMRRLDEQMERQFPGMSWNYSKLLRKYSPMSVVVIIFYFAVGLVYLANLMNCSCDVLNTVLIAISYSCLTCAPACAGFLHIGQMDLLRIRYRFLRHMIVLQYERAPRDARAACSTFRRLIGYYKQYTQLILQVNEVFGHTMAASTFYDFYILTCMTFLLCQKASTSARTEEYFFILLFMVPRLYKVTMSSVYGYAVKREQRRCLQAILSGEQHFGGAQGESLKWVLHDFLHWKMHNSYDFTMGQNVRYSLNVGYMVLHGVVNYVIILIQLQFQQNNIANNLKTNLGPLAKDVEILRRKP